MGGRTRLMAVRDSSYGILLRGIGAAAGLMRGGPPGFRYGLCGVDSTPPTPCQRARLLSPVGGLLAGGPVGPTWQVGMDVDGYSVLRARVVQGSGAR